MHVLFVLNIPYAIEPHGVMLLSAICKQAGHRVSLTLLKKHDLVEQVKTLQPDVVAYSVIGSELEAFAPADERLREYLKTSGKRVFRIMGGPHPTFTPGILVHLQLDALCQGDGNAFTSCWSGEKGESLEESPTSASPAGAVREKLNSEELDCLLRRSRYLL